ncbi:MAG: hypothetical protein IPL84_04685 [Chitinophagaceae bacterium]|nr:hypothetical protein [Chitinophagaceae bacterium]
MKIKLLAATVLFLALGITTTEAQNRQLKERSQLEQAGRKGGEFSKSDKWNKTKKDGKFRKADGKFKADKMTKGGHGKKFRKNKRHHQQHGFRGKHRRSNRY